MISDAAAVKSRRMTGVGAEDTPDDTNHQGPCSNSFTHFATVSHFSTTH